MQTQKGKKVLFGAIAVAALMCLAGAGPAISASEHSTQQTEKVTVEPIHEPIPTPTGGMQSNVQISTFEGDDVHPSITSSSGTVAVAYEKVESLMKIPNVISSSSDGGESWTEQFAITTAELSGSGVARNPDISYNPTTDEFFFTASDQQSEYGTVTGWFKSDLSDYKYISAYNTKGATDSAVTPVGQWEALPYVDDSYHEDGMGLFYLRLNPDSGEPQFPGDYGYGALGSYYDGESITDTSPARALEIDSGSERMYFVIEHPNETTGKNEIVYKETVTDLNPDSDTFLFQGGGGPGGMDKYADIEVWPWQGILKSNELYTYEDPDVSTSGSNAAVVYQTTDNNYGDYDIHCTYTTDNGETWQTVPVAENHPADDTNPAVYMSGSTVYCVYVSDGNIYLIESEDAGASWGEPEQLNEEDGTVVAGEDTADIDAGGIVWTDNRNGNKDIYYNVLPAPKLGVESISGPVGITATVSNTGTEDASSVAWTIDLSGPVFVGSHAEGTIDSLPAGESTTISSGLAIGIGPTTISVNAGGATGSASGFILGPLVLGL